MKDSIVAALKEADGPVSGELLAGRLGVSRAALWKHMEGLRAAGYVIDGSPKVGYRLMSEPDLILASALSSLLPGEFKEKVVRVDEADSTNTLAKELASSGRLGPVGLVVAESQTGGRGRFGRRWHSPHGGIWFSLVIRPRLSVREAGVVPLLASVVTAEAVAEATGLDVRIKWPNDLLIEGKKVAGILTELAAELGEIDYLVVGVGLNANVSFDELGDSDLAATTLMDETGRAVDRPRLIAKIVNRFLSDLAGLPKDVDKMLRRWRARSATLGRTVTVTAAGEAFTGEAIDLDSEGGLIVVDKAGTRRVFRAGEVTLGERV